MMGVSKNRGTLKKVWFIMEKKLYFSDDSGENPLFSEFHPDVFSSFFGNKSLRLPRGSTSRGSPHGHVGCDGLDLATVVFLLAAGGRTPGR